ncbi:MAG: flagellin FliC3 [Blautia sp.]|nr:flagellin FliC3 [Blautia sp.]
MRINYNVSAMLSNNALANNDSLLSQSLERLSSGLKINSAKDNPAGLAMAKRMNAQIGGLDVASQNASDGVSVISIADGALSEVSDMLQRMNELAVKAANGTMSEEDNAVIQSEIAQLKEEITRVSETTEFNGQKLLNGEFSWKGYIKEGGQMLDIKVNSYSSDVPAKEYKVTSMVVQKDADGNYTVPTFTPEKDGGFPEDVKASVEKDLLTLKSSNGFEMKLDLSRSEGGTYGPFTIDATGIGAMRLQIGANEGQVLPVDIPAITLQNMGIEDMNVDTTEDATEAIESIKGAIRYVSGVRGKLGAYQNRLESTINSLDVAVENMTGAYSRLMDVDMAEEMTNYTTYQVLTQAGTSMLAQANERPSQVLQLLQ